MTKLRAVLAAAVALVATGTAIGVALNQAGVAEGMTAEEWIGEVERVRDAQKREWFYVAARTDFVPDEAYGDRLIGERSGKRFMIKPDAVDGGVTYRAKVEAEECNPEPQCDVAGPFAGHCIYTHNADGLTSPPDIGATWETLGSWGGSYVYEFTCGPTVDGWKVCSVYEHPYLAKAWKLGAAEEAGLTWLGSFSSVVSKCLEHTTAAKCMTLLDVDSKCWVWDLDPAPGRENFVPGDRCRRGYHLGHDEPCDYVVYPGIMTGTPCTVNRGAGSEDSDSGRVPWTDEEMAAL